MKVMFIGYPKTGTKSMYTALTELGYSVYDFEHNFFYLRKEWLRIFKEGGTKEDFYRMYKDVDACVSSPTCLFWEEMLEAFPDMKLIYSKRRTEDEWAESYRIAAADTNKNESWKLSHLFSPTARSFASYFEHLHRVLFCSSGRDYWLQFVVVNPSPGMARKKYREHNSNIEMRAPKDKLLHYDLRDGWKPLCEFLDKPIPNKPFPHLNKRDKGMQDIMQTRPIFVKMENESKIGFAVFIVLFSIFFYFVLVA